MTRPRMKALVAGLALALVVPAAGGIRAYPGSASQLQLPPSELGRVGLGLMLRRLANVGTFMMATAHPDDENNALLTMMARGRGLRTVLATATRGDGGQNEIGPELFDALAVLRTEELMALHRYDGAEQSFTRAVDFGYSFSLEETFSRWGRDEIVGDFVRLIRTVRPDVIVAMRPDGTGGGLHHQASAILAHEAWLAAGDPARYPDQLRDGLRVWQPKKFYFTSSFGFPGEPAPPPGTRVVPVDGNIYDPLLGRTYTELGSAARSMHKCQGMAQLLALPGGPSISRYTLTETTIPGQKEKDEASLLDGVDVRVSSLASFAGPTPPARLAAAIAALALRIEVAQKAFDGGELADVLPLLLQGLDQTRQLRRDLTGMGTSADAALEIDMRLARKEREFQDAAVIASGVRIEVLADDGTITRGQPLKLRTIVANRATSDVDVKGVSYSGFAAQAGCTASTVKPGAVFTCAADVEVPRDAAVTSIYWRRAPDADRYVFDKDVPFGVPFRPTPFRARVQLDLGGRGIESDLPIQYRYEGNIFSGEKRMELKVVPAVSVQMTPEIAIVPTSAPGKVTRELRVTATNAQKGAAQGEVSLSLPDGWRATPLRAPVSFAREDEAQTIRFTIAPPPKPAPGRHPVTAIVSSGGVEFDAGYQVVEYPHIERRHLNRPAVATVESIDVKVAAGLTVGYVTGVGDQVPPAIQQLGARVALLGPDDLEWGDLSRFNVIMTGVRAYERRPDLRANNDRLLRYAAAGGVVIVQYNKFEFNDAQFGPFAAKVSSSRVTDERAPVEVLVPGHPVFTTPNRIDESTWRNWVQERGLYFLGDKDPHYVDLVRMEDPFPNNPGPRLGALVEARVGKGRWLYVGLGLWRQLPAGTEGAYRLLANLISLGKRPAAVAPRPLPKPLPEVEKK